MPEASGEPPSPEATLGEEVGGDAMAVEEARKRIRAQLDSGEDPLTPTVEREGHDVLERLHLRPTAKASRDTPEEKCLGTDISSGALLTGGPARRSVLGCTGGSSRSQGPTPCTDDDRPGHPVESSFLCSGHRAYCADVGLSAP
eukprot:5321646-Amphidinium_carterae.2